LIDSAHITSHSTLQQDDYIIGGPGPDFVFGDHGIIILNETKPYKLDFASTTDPNCTPGNDTIFGNEERDVIVGGGGLFDVLYGNEGPDIIATDFAVIRFNSSHPNLYGVVSIDTVNCSIDGGINYAFGEEDDDILLGGGSSIDHLDGGDGNDLAAGDCVSIVYDANHFIASITSTYTSFGKQDNITLGDGDNFAIGGYGGDWIWAGNGSDIVVGDSAEILFYEETPLPDSLFWNVPKSITTIDCEYSGEDHLFGGDGEVDYIIGGGEVSLMRCILFGD
jgi:Ca2+-binding RTX toxin-like protein